VKWPMKREEKAHIRCGRQYSERENVSYRPKANVDNWGGGPFENIDQKKGGKGKGKKGGGGEKERTKGFGN